MYKMRIFFEKKDEASYISHLDLMRTLQRAFLRAGLPVKYSEGFNPHICMSILSPLPTGFESLYELCDVELTCDALPDNAKEGLQNAMPRGITVNNITEALSKPSGITAAVYKVSAEGGNAEEIKEAFNEPLITEKKTKKGVKTIDVRDYINDISFDFRDDHTLMTVKLKMGEEQINPSHIIKALREKGLLPADGAFFCTRTALLCADNELFK